MRENSESQTAKTAAETPRRGRTGPRVSIVLYHRDGTTSVELRAGASVVVGRTEPSNVQIPDPSLSRMHARFGWDGSVLTVSDLDSTNGTWLRGEPIEQAVLGPGDELSLGQVNAVAHVLSGQAGTRPALLGYDSAVGALAAELERARYFGRPVALSMLRLGAGGPLSLGSLCERLADTLRPVDTLGLYGADSVLVIQPEQDRATAEASARTLLAAAGVPVRCGVASFPETARSHEALVGAARDACLSATPVQPLVVSDPERTASFAPDGEVVRCDPQMLALHATVQQIANKPLPVLVTGETGVGKELLVGELHAASGRKGPLKAINCGTLPRELTESILFGHEKGAFTGAASRSRGLFEEASGGTLFLDEIGELSATAQAALLRALQNKRIMRVGSTQEIEVDVRVVAATHRDLEAMTESGEFRADLLYRLNTVVLEVPPLRERASEIGPLADRFLHDAIAAWGGPARSIGDEARQCLERYDWPGNVRQLRNVIERAAALCEREQIAAFDLPRQLREASAGPPATLAPPALPGLGTPGAEPEGGGNDTDFRAQSREFERQLIERTLRQSAGNVTEAARLLGLPVRTLRFKMQGLGITRP